MRSRLCPWESMRIPRSSKEHAENILWSSQGHSKILIVAIQYQSSPFALKSPLWKSKPPRPSGAVLERWKPTLWDRCVLFANSRCKSTGEICMSGLPRCNSSKNISEMELHSLKGLTIHRNYYIKNVVNESSKELSTGSEDNRAKSGARNCYSASESIDVFSPRLHQTPL